MAKTKNTDAAAEKATLNRYNLLKEIAVLEEKIAKDYETTGVYSVEQNKQLEKTQKNLVKIDKFLDGNNVKIKEGIDLYKDTESSISSMSNMMGGFKNQIKATTEFGVEFSKSIANSSSTNKAVFEDSNRLLSEMSSITAELSQLNKEDTIEIASKSQELQSLYAKLSNSISSMDADFANLSDSDKQILKELKEQYGQMLALGVGASKFANVSKEVKEVYEDLGTDLESLQKTFQKIVITAQIFFSSLKNSAGLTLMFVGGLVDDFNTLAKEVGGTVTQMFQLKAQSFLVSKILGDEAGAAVTSLAEKLGNANDVTLGMSINVGVLSNRLGVSGEEAATLVNQFGNLSGLSSDIAMDTMEAASQLASANGVAPAKVMSDIAENTEFFALYSKNGGANIAAAAIEARRLGVDLSTAAKISDTLLDYQSSVASEMQASVLLGRNLNLNRARELAYAGDSVGAMKAGLEAAGGIAEFNKMDVYQKKAVAEALGTSVSELQQMSANMERAATPAGKLEESFHATTAFVQEMGAGITGTAVKGIGAMLIGMKDFKGQLSDAKEGFDFLKNAGATLLGKGDGLGSLLASKTEAAILSKSSPVASLAETATDNIKDKASSLVTDKIDTITSPEAVEEATTSINKDKSIGDKLKDLSKGLKAMGNGQVLFGALNLIPTALGFLALLPGLPGMFAISAIGIPAGAGLKGLASGLKAFGKAAPEALIGIGMLALFGIALIPFTYALSLLAPLVESIGKSVGSVIESIGKGIASVVGSIGDLMVKVLPLINMEAAVGVFALASAFGVLSFALGTFATAGFAALPVLAAIGLAAGAVGMLMAGGEAEGGESNLLLEEIKGLRNDIQTQPIMVQLDGRQVYMSNLRQQKNKSN